MDYKKVIKDLTGVYKTEEQASDYAWLVFLYGLSLVNNILFSLHTNKDKKISVPEKYAVVYTDCVNYYNQYYGGNNGQT